MTTNYTQMGTNRSGLYNVVDAGSLFFAYGEDSFGGMGVREVDVNAGTAGVIIGDENDLTGNSDPIQGDGRNRLIFFNGSLFWHVYRTEDVEGTPRNVSQIWSYDGTPGNWTRQLDTQADFGIINDTNPGASYGMFGDDSTGFLYLIDTYGNFYASSNGVTWAMDALPDIRDNAGGSQNGSIWGSAQGQVYALLLEETTSDPLLWRLTGASATLTWDNATGIGIIGGDWRNVWRRGPLQFSSTADYSRDAIITGSTSWIVPDDNRTPFPTHNLFGYTVGMNKGTGEIYLWEDSPDQWDTTEDGDIDDGTSGDKLPIFYFKLPSNGQTYVVYQEESGAQDYKLARRNITLPVILPPTTGVFHSTGGMPGKII